MYETKECVICGGTGSGRDGVYAQVSEQQSVSTTTSFPASQSDNDDAHESPAVASEKDGSQNGQLREDPDPSSLNVGLSDLSLVKSLTSALSISVMSVHSPRRNFQPGADMLQLHKDFESRRSTASHQIALKMSQGWTLLNSTCPQCAMPLMADEHERNEICVVCGIADRTTMTVRSMGTAATDISSDKSKDFSSEGEFLSDTPSESFQEDTTEILLQRVRDREMSSFSDNITDMIVRSSKHIHHPSPRGDPPAFRPSPRKNQLEVEDSRVDQFLSSFDPVISSSSQDKIKARGPSPRYAIKSRHDPTTEESDEDQKNEENAYIIVLDDDESVESKDISIKMDSENDPALAVDESQVFAIAVPKGFNVGEGRAVTEILNAAKQSEAKNKAPLQEEEILSPDEQSTTGYRLPSPGLTEASFPGMSPGSQNLRCPDGESASQRTRPWGNCSPTLNSNKPPPAHRSKQSLRDPCPINDKQGVFSSGGSSTSSGSARRRVTPELPAGKPRGIARCRSTPRLKRRGVWKRPAVSPIKESQSAPTKAFNFDNQSTVSASSSASSVMQLRVPMSNGSRPYSTSSDTSEDENIPEFAECLSPLEDIDAGSTLSNTRSVTSEAIDQLLMRIEETQKELQETEKEKDGADKQERLKELLDRLTQAAEAIQELDG
jgi:uncharacterized Zn finger protein (UPF0148 family)